MPRQAGLQALREEVSYYQFSIIEEKMWKLDFPNVEPHLKTTWLDFSLVPGNKTYDPGGSKQTNTTKGKT